MQEICSRMSRDANEPDHHQFHDSCITRGEIREVSLLYELQKLADVPTYYVVMGQAPDTRTYEYILILFDEFSKVLQLIKCMAKYYDEFFPRINLKSCFRITPQ